MIIDSPAVVDIAVGVDRRIMEAGDAQVMLKPEVDLEVPLMKATRTVRSTTTEQQESAFVHLSQTRTNQAALTTTIMTLAKGLWTVQISLSTKFNWSVAAATLAGVKAEMVYSGDTNTLLIHWANTLSNHSQMEYSFLLIESAIIQLTTDVTGAAQTSDARCSVNAIRRI